MKLKELLKKDMEVRAGFRLDSEAITGRQATVDHDDMQGRWDSMQLQNTHF